MRNFSAPTSCKEPRDIDKRLRMVTDYVSEVSGLVVLMPKAGTEVTDFRETERLAYHMTDV